MAENGFLSSGNVSFKRFEYQGLIGRIRVEPHYGLGVRVSCRVDLKGDNGPGEGLVKPQRRLQVVKLRKRDTQVQAAAAVASSY